MADHCAPLDADLFTKWIIAQAANVVAAAAAATTTKWLHIGCVWERERKREASEFGALHC